MDTLNWVNVEVDGLKNMYRCLHSSVLVDSKLIIFGGYCE